MQLVAKIMGQINGAVLAGTWFQVRKRQDRLCMTEEFGPGSIVVEARKDLHMLRKMRYIPSIPEYLVPGECAQPCTLTGEYRTHGALINMPDTITQHKLSTVSASSDAFTNSLALSPPIPETC